MRVATFWLGVSLVLVDACGGRSQGGGASSDVQPTGAAGTPEVPARCVCQLGEPCMAGCVCPATVCDGICLDTSADTANCGVCGRTCNTQCAAGRCVDVLAKDLHSPTALAVGPTDLFWTSSLGIMQMSKTGGDAKVIAPQDQGGFPSDAIALDDEYVYWSGNFDHVVMRAAIAAPMPEVFADPQQLPSGSFTAIALDRDTVYWCDWQNGKIWSMPKAGGTPQLLTDAAHRPRGLAVDATRLYWVEDLDEGGVMSMPLAGGAITTLASGQTDPRGLAINATHVYWTTRDELSSVPLGGGLLEKIAMSDVYPENLVLDDKFAYWVGGYAVQKVALEGGAPQRQPGDEFVNDVVVDEQSIFFVQEGTGGSGLHGSLVRITPK